MSGLKPFDILSVPLCGTYLIEASAGTGKTFTITNLVLRLVVEERLDIGRILAVTFTEAATKELRARIRRVLNEAQFFLDNPDSAGHPVAAAVVRQAVRLGDRPTVEKALRKAILSFDEAGIFTIHGFCNRILSQFAFESSLRFKTELVTDQSRFVAEVADDFWRQTFGRADRLLCAVAMKNGLSPDKLAGFSRILIDKPTLMLIPDAPTEAPRNLLGIFETIRREWPEHRDRIMDILRDDQRLSRAKDAYRPDVLEEHAVALDRLCDNDIDAAGLTAIKWFTPEILTAKLKRTKRDQGAPAHPFFDLCRDFVLTEKACAIHYRHEFRKYLALELSRRKRANNVQYFSDLLTGLQRALAADSQGVLASAIREKYRAVLIDEFQDTDPVQYDIFNRLFGSEEQRLFLIGDPKQSIFAFRSADVFSYIRSATDIAPDRKFALPWNWRSETALVEAVNRFFGQADNPFILGDAIGFSPVKADSENVGNRSPLRIDGRKSGHMKLWFIGKDGDDGALNREQARDLVIDAVAGEIAALLNRSAGGGVKIGENPLSPAHIAVLITRNEDAGRIKDRLAALDIPAVVSRTGGVFSSPEAEAVERVLLAMAAPADSRRINAALADDMIGCSAEDIRAFTEDDGRYEAYEGHLRLFAEYHRIWRSGGFIRVFRRFMSDYRVRERLLGFPNGERRLTNVMHLAELIHQAEVSCRPGMNGLLDWIADKRGAGEEGDDEEQLRLERDDEAVQILTVWKSKGLQYPVVFCPFMWGKGASVKDDNIIFHEDRSLNLDIGAGDQDHKQAAARENLSELVRLLYVAVTRAVNRCYLVYGKIGDPARSGATCLDYVLTGGLPADAVRLDALKTTIREMSAEELYRLVAERLGPAAGLIDLGPYKPVPADPYRPVSAGGRGKLKRRRFPGDRIDQEWGIASFTHLASRGRMISPSRDEGEIKQDEFSGKPVTEDRPPAGTIFDFPAGPNPGLCVHSIFEKLDFSLSRPEEARQLIDIALRQYGLDKPSAAGTLWHDVVYQMVLDVLDAPVLPHAPGFTLGTLSRDRMITEMEFYYPVDRLTPGKIRTTMPRLPIGGDMRRIDFSDSLDRLEFRPLHGYMRGFIDLIFEHDGKYYLLDWKTNHLGNARQDYDSTRLNRCVAEESYFLQYYIYTVALHRYLTHRLPGYDYETHFGGVVYLFVRGVTPAIPGNGVYFDRPSAALTVGLNDMLG